MKSFNLIDLIRKYREEYSIEHPTQSSFGLKPTVKKDVFGNETQELGSLDQLEIAINSEKFQKDRDTWVFRKILDETEGMYFQELTAIMGNNYGLKPCDGLLWPQCTFFCDDYGHCDYEKKAQKEVEEKKKPKVEVEIAGGGSTGSEKAKKKRKKKKK